MWGFSHIPLVLAFLDAEATAGTPDVVIDFVFVKLIMINFSFLHLLSYNQPKFLVSFIRFSFLLSLMIGLSTLQQDVSMKCRLAFQVHIEI